MIDWQNIHNESHTFSSGIVPLNTPFTANILSIQVATKPEYDKQIIGYLYQFSGLAIKKFNVFSGSDVLFLALPEIDRLEFIPVSFLNEIYTLKIDIATIGSDSSTTALSALNALTDSVNTLSSKSDYQVLSLSNSIDVDGYPTHQLQNNFKYYFKPSLNDSQIVLLLPITSIEGDTLDIHIGRVIVDIYLQYGYNPAIKKLNYLNKAANLGYFGAILSGLAGISLIYTGVDWVTRYRIGGFSPYDTAQL